MAHHILIVEDEPNIVVLLQYLMKLNGYEVRVAASGEEALEEIRQAAPDLILLDIKLPGIDGYEVCENIRQNPRWKHIKIIFLTAKGRKVDVSKGMILGADAYIVKPFANTEVVDKVQELLGQSDSRPAE